MAVFDYPSPDERDYVPGTHVITAVDHGGDQRKQLRSTIPKDIVERFGIEDGDKLAIRALQDGPGYEVRVIDL